MRFQGGDGEDGEGYDSTGGREGGGDAEGLEERVLFGRPFYWMQLNESNGFSRLMILVSGF